MTKLHQPSPELAAIVGNTPLSWVKIMELVREYIRVNDLNRFPYVLVDDGLKALVGERERVSANELTRTIKQHVTPSGRSI